MRGSYNNTASGGHATTRLGLEPGHLLDDSPGSYNRNQQTDWTENLERLQMEADGLLENHQRTLHLLDNAADTTSYDINTSIGDDMGDKQEDITRIYFVNINGIAFGAEGGECTKQTINNRVLLKAALQRVVSTLESRPPGP